MNKAVMNDFQGHATTDDTILSSRVQGRLPGRTHLFIIHVHVITGHPAQRASPVWLERLHGLLLFDVEDLGSKVADNDANSVHPEISS